jgi:hypothetical protein
MRTDATFDFCNSIPYQTDVEQPGRRVQKMAQGDVAVNVAPS